MNGACARTTLADIAALAGVTRGRDLLALQQQGRPGCRRMLDTLHEPLDEMARASESEDELDPLGCMRKLLIHLFHQIGPGPENPPHQ